MRMLGTEDRIAFDLTSPQQKQKLLESEVFIYYPLNGAGFCKNQQMTCFPVDSSLIINLSCGVWGLGFGIWGLGFGSFEFSVDV